tara:strand:+ start:274 stop:399 length:126 start_codon:yes stop_codon:yes gene_type:complete
MIMKLTSEKGRKRRRKRWREREVEESISLRFSIRRDHDLRK